MELLEKISPYVYPGVADNDFSVRTKEIILDVCYEYLNEVDGITSEEIQSKIRKRPLVDARKMLAQIMRYVLRMRVVRIGEHLNVDHSTVVHYGCAFSDLYDNDSFFRSKYDGLLSRLQVRKLL